MLKYLIIPLANNAVSFCHYSQLEDDGIISDENLKEAVDFALKENLSVQFIYPRQILSENKKSLIDNVDHIDIISCNSEDTDLLAKAEVIVFDNWEDFKEFPLSKDSTYIVRTDIKSLSKNTTILCDALKTANRINVIFRDDVKFDESSLKEYHIVLQNLISVIITEYKKHHFVQLNILTDRLFLTEMNNCNAGNETLTIAPNGKFYICPAFYNAGLPYIGDLHHELVIKNEQLYKISHAPICRICDAWQCKRCIWLNKKYTHEVNTPSHEQCVVSHIERNTSRKLLSELQEIGFMPDYVITEIDYLDPFETIKQKKLQ